MRTSLMMFLLVTTFCATTAFALDECSDCKSRNMTIGGTVYVYEYCVKSLSGSIPNCQTVDDGAGNSTCQSIYSVESGNCGYGVSPLPNSPIQRDPSDGTQWTTLSARPLFQTASASIGCAAAR